MASVLTPVKPMIKTRYGARPIYTINKFPNHIYGMKPPNDKLRTCVVSFVNESHAYMFAAMFEEHKRRTSEWPMMMQETEASIILPTNDEQPELEELSVIKWDPENLKVMCASNILDLIKLTKIVHTKKGLTIGGETYHFNAPIEFYQNRFKELYDS